VAIRPVVHQVDRRQQLRVKQASRAVVEEVALLRVHRALDLTAIVVQLVERDSRVNVGVEVLHVVHSAVQDLSACGSFFDHHLAAIIVLITVVVFVDFLAALVVFVVLVFVAVHLLVVRTVVTDGGWGVLVVVSLPSECVVGLLIVKRLGIVRVVNGTLKRSNR